jgi:signal transduction histidine kinase
MQNVRVDTFMEKFHPLVSNDLEKRGIGIKKIFSTDDIWARTDPRALQQVLLNLVTNAADACEGREGSEIVIEIHGRRGLIAIAVKDNGCGMTEEQQQDLFKPFFTSKTKGTGLGLVIVKKMLTAMDSTIDIESRENEGTTVTLFIPKADGES